MSHKAPRLFKFDLSRYVSGLSCCFACSTDDAVTTSGEAAASKDGASTDNGDGELPARDYRS